MIWFFLKRVRVRGRSLDIVFYFLERLRVRDRSLDFMFVPY